MKTDDEMIKSLFERREEYYAATAKKSAVMAAIKAVCGAVLPIAAAGTAAMFLILAQKNIISDIDISRNEMSDTVAADTAEPFNGDMGVTDDFTKLKNLTVSPPLCFSFDGQIYGAAEEQSDSFEEYAASKLTEAGIARVLETNSDESECTVYRLDDSDLKVLKTKEGIKFYRPIGKSSYTVSGREFEIKALHSTAEKYRATAMPICREGDNTVFRACDESGKLVKDVFMLYTTELLCFDSVLWEVTGNIPENTRDLENYPDLDFIEYFNLIVLCERIRSNGLKANDLIGEYGCNTDVVIDGELISKGIQVYYTDLNYTEYVLEAYADSDEIAITRMATGESVFITDDICDYREFLNPDRVPLAVKGEEVNVADTVSRLMEKHVRGSAEGNGLTEKEIIMAGFTKSEDVSDKYELYYTFNGKEYVAEAYIDKGTDNVGVFIADAEDCVLVEDVLSDIIFNDLTKLF